MNAEILIEKIDLFFPAKLRPKHVAMVKALTDEIDMLKAEWHGEIERSKFYAKAVDNIVRIRDLQIEQLCALLSEALEHALEHHGWFSATAQGSEWIRRAREVVDSRREDPAECLKDEQVQGRVPG